MVFDQIEKLKHDFTDKYVIVDETSPEFARFRGQTGRVKTVNMSGRALVEFDANNNIGWYDIDLGFLKVIDQPLSDAEKAAAKRESPKEAPAAKADAPAKPAAAAGKKTSTADILAAARANKATAAPPAPPPAKAVEAPAAEAAAPVEEAVVEAAPAPAPKKAAVSGDKPKAGQLAVPEILAWCRAHDAK